MSTPDAAPLTLHVVRHGRTRYNTDRRVQGWSDSPLTEEGAAAVDVLAGRLATVPFVGAYCSSSPRTRATAERLLAVHDGLTATPDPRLREMNFGRFEAGPESAVGAHIDPAVLFPQTLDGVHEGLPEGEPSWTYLSRVARGFLDIERAHPDGGDVLVVSHGITILVYAAMVSAGLADRPSLRHLPNASVTRVRISPDRGLRTVEALGEVAGEAPVAPLPPVEASGVALELAATLRGPSRPS